MKEQIEIYIAVYAACIKNGDTSETAEEQALLACSNLKKKFGCLV